MIVPYHLMAILILRYSIMNKTSKLVTFNIVLMEWKRSYAHKKLRETIFAMAVGPDDVRKRLAQTFQGFHTLKKEHFPEELQVEWELILNALKKAGPVVREDGSIFIGSVENTCYKMKKKTGEKIARKILVIYEYLDLH